MRNLELALLNTRDRRLAAGAERVASRLAHRFPAARGARASVVLTTDAVLAGLNRRWRRRDRPTDVLSFPMGYLDPETGRRVLGEIYVSRERARAQGRAYGTGYHGELERLITHGLLHLLGLSHREMAALEPPPDND
ncbi:MAG: rRNA maturation RNase YbeY [bacterium]